MQARFIERSDNFGSEFAQLLMRRGILGKQRSQCPSALDHHGAHFILKTGV
jgi:hypothetical protein